MTNRISITIDVSKINKSKIVDRKYINRDKQEVLVKDYKVELIEMKEPKVIKDGDGWTLKKTHFLVEAQTKEERAAKAKGVFVGEGFMFIGKEGEPENQDTGASADINTEDIPF